MPTNRRQFLSDTFSATTSFAAGAALSALGGRMAHGESPVTSHGLVETLDETTGMPLLRLPEGFRYKSFGWTGDLMSDGTKTPASHDGMAVVKADGSRLTLIRNHEISDDGSCFPIRRGTTYDRKASAGCTNLIFNTDTGELEKSWVGMSGTSRNCAGGVTPWGTWLTAEETVLGVGSIDTYNDDVLRSFEKSHGWIFEVPAGSTDAADGVPLTAMGRFVHEAVAIDRETGIVYETEDRETAGFYRFIPKTPGKLADGGVLEMAEVIGQPDLRGGVANGSEFDVRWHRIQDPTLAHTPGTTDELGVYTQGKKSGGTTFSRLEGCWFGNGKVYFDATDGGAAKAGQIWQYEPRSDKLTLIFESPAKPILNMPDNLCVSPRGGILLCEDSDYGPNEFPQRVHGISQDGRIKLFAQNNIQLNGEKNNFRGDFRAREWAGATFSPDGKWLFVNIQTPGITFAITGPWEDTLV